MTELKGLNQIKEFGKESLSGNMINLCEDFHFTKEEEWKISYGITEKEKSYLHQWTGLNSGEILYDSDIDGWKDLAPLQNAMFGKKHLILIIFDINDEKFGIYLHSEVQKIFYSYQSIDNQSFHFNLESNGRLLKPMKFEMKYSCSSNIWMQCEEDVHFVTFGDIHLCYQQTKEDSSIEAQYESSFNYYGIENALCGSDWHFTPRKIILIQMI